MDFSLKAVFGLDATGVKTELKQLRKETNDFVNDWGKLALAAAGAAFVAMAKGAIDLASSLSDTSQNIGVNVESLQALEAQHKRNGVSQETLTKALEKTKAAVIAAAEGDEKATAALEKLGLKAADLIRLPLDQQYEQIAKGAANAKDQNEAFAAVSSLLGEKVGPKLMSSLRELSEVGLPGVVKAATEAGQVMSAETIASLDAAGDAIDDFKKKATVAVGNIIVNFRSEEGLKLLLYQFLEVVGKFGGGILDALNEAAGMVSAVVGGAVVGVANKFRDGLLDALEFVAVQINKVLPDKFSINIANIEDMKSAGRGIGDEITAAIARTSPSTFKKDIGDYWDKTISDQKQVVDALNHTTFAKDAQALRDAGNAAATSLDKSMNDFAHSIDAALDDFFNGTTKAADSFTVVADSVTEAWNAMVEAADDIDKKIRDFTGLALSITRTGTKYEDQSTASLTGVRGRLNAQLSGLGNQGEEIRNATMGGDYGGWLTANTIRGELATIDRELALRAQIKGVVDSMGESAARSQFGDADTDRALRDVQASTQRTTTAVERIASGLASRDIIPKV